MQYQVNGETVNVSLSPLADGQFSVTIGDQTHTIRAEPTVNGGWLLKMDGQQIIAYSVAHGSERHIFVNGENFTLTVPDARSARRKTAPGAGDLTAQMPGQVVNVMVVAGESVIRGQTLVILEAMKMEIRVAAPSDGVVKRLLVTKGQIVERGQLLLEFEA
jgi:biotin carboxyl carrier protein